jgi:ring-1,2-phenylacetyl-CoA epoxidase subunit PaaE
VLAFAAGVGITPIMAMVEHAMQRQPATRFTLVYGNRSTESIIFRERLEDLKDAHVDRLTLMHVLSRNEESDTPLLEGRITADKVQAFAGHLFHVDDVDHVFVCGPGTMIRDVRNALFSMGFARDRVHHEFFAAGGGAYRSAPVAGVAVPRETGAAASATAPERVASDGVETRSAEIVAVLDGVRHRFWARPGEAVVDAALRAGIRAPYSCKGGMCSTCRARIVEGRASMRLNYSLEPWEVEKGFVLTCQAIAETARLVVDYDQM